MQARLLGTPSLVVSGQAVRPPSRKSLALLTYVALEGPTPRERLAGLLWSDLPPDGARHNLRQELYRLGRSALAPYLVATPDTVGLTPEVRVDALDVLAFEAAGDHEAALGRYGGPLLDGVDVEGAGGFEEWRQAQRDRLTQAWRRAMTARAAAREAAGDLRGALQAHLEVLAEDALQETHQREAIRLHHALGERAQARERYQEFRALLARELGLDPLPETAAVAAARPERVEPERAAPATEPIPLRPPLVGREGTWAALEAVPCGLALLEGDGGVGKTRLALAFAASFGVPVVCRALEVTRDTPLAPVAGALRAALEDVRAAERLRALEEPWRAETARLVPELAGAAPLPDDNRARFLEGLTRALLAAAGQEGALVFDDIQWADGSTLELMAGLAQRTRGLAHPPRLLATARTPDLDRSPACRAALSGLKRDGVLHVLPLGGLSEDEVRRLVGALSGNPGATLFPGRLHRATSGNPLFLMETLRALHAAGTLRIEGGVWSTPYDDRTVDYAELPIPPGVQEAVLRRVEAFGPLGRRFLDAAGVSADPFFLEDLAAVTAASEWEALETLEGLTGRGLLEPRGPGYAFPHDLVRRSVRAAMSPERARLLHRRLAGVLETRSAPPAQIAEHLQAAGQPREAARWHVRAADAARGVYAYREALEHLERALASAPPPEDAFAWQRQRADLCVHLDDRDARGREIDRLAVLAEQLGTPEAHVTVLTRRAALLDDLGRHEELGRLMAGALPLPEVAPELRAHALHLAGTAEANLRRPAAAERHLRAALAVSPLSNVRRRAILGSLLPGLLDAGRMDEARALIQESLDLARAAQDRHAVALVLNSAARVAFRAGDLAGAVRDLEAGLREARAIHDLRLHTAFLINVIQVHVRAGQLDPAVAALQEGFDLVYDAADPKLEADFQHRLGDVQLLRGRLGPALTAYQAACRSADALGQRTQQLVRRVKLVRLLVALGDAAGARAAAAELTRLIGAGEHEGDARTGRTEHARALLASGDPAGALRALDAAPPSGAAPEREGEQDERALRAEVLLALGDAPGASRVLDTINEPSLRPLALALRVHVARGLGDDDPAPLAAVREALQLDHLPPLDRLRLYRADPADPGGLPLARSLAATLPADRRPAFLAHWGLPDTAAVERGATA
ncbi:ATP-binding protein [Deinococcus sonorensis]|uniref:AAA family ATPase n=2 Tax=Deinococcus sonorensis TaxID=309891 RepID=A0AAU7U5Z9_9DEIO